MGAFLSFDATTQLKFVMEFVFFYGKGVELGSAVPAGLK